MGILYNKMDVGMHLKWHILVITCKKKWHILVITCKDYYIFQQCLNTPREDQRSSCFEDFTFSQELMKGFYLKNNCGQECGEATDRYISELYMIAEFSKGQIKIFIN